MLSSKTAKKLTHNTLEGVEKAFSKVASQS